MCAEQTTEISQQLTTNLESAWGSDYPSQETIDDVENGPILKFLYEVMTLFTEVNDVCRSSHPSMGDTDAVENKIKRFEEVRHLASKHSVWLMKLAFSVFTPTHNHHGAAAITSRDERW